jgi:hypothetical protein
MKTHITFIYNYMCVGNVVCSSSIFLKINHKINHKHHSINEKQFEGIISCSLMVEVRTDQQAAGGEQGRIC